ncbi:MAG: hypothetical protein AVDCRST_MAG86-2727 [uncultured Truepera sp.]|uniref:Uncharacterized protein n=1 Tax=uncultured Truepera sp. TaxID=543023 RepID=A0A6J4VR69_9DEIN|nr:MAG: hypothetical protein AVDCRST_MAG86-2727 [uncultured Truepera sp.]
MAVRERLIKRLEQMDEGQLEYFEKRLKQEDKKRSELVQRFNHERRERIKLKRQHSGWPHCVQLSV